LELKYYTVKELLKKIIASTDIKRKIIEIPDQRTEEIRYSIVIQKLRNFALEAKVTLDQGLDKTITWFKTQD